MSMFDHHDTGYSVERIYEAADWMVKERRENPTRYVCPLGCGADFATPFGREIHIICYHEGKAA